ncbi:hypothetical protein IQ273_07525 [Nodosilinea sp. LEGE 07298]|uniref:hypothetical protein n=1 Tax=Nodosilinea sp. LEGE 07298 TaxID=2777970 RepID=UPI001881D9B3|nr:hypothetical protein [Nodosilinea sp. LEGE 07298]MBE9109264.1 hypothetical protein [Nodosilinea sp. LEGE 07298]
MAQNWDILKARYLRSSQETQLQNLVLNLVRIQLFAQSGTNGLVAQHLVRETQFIIEWVVPRIDLATDMAFATALVDLQRLLSRWKLEWSVLWADESERQEIAMLGQQWCNYLIDNMNC